MRPGNLEDHACVTYIRHMLNILSILIGLVSLVIVIPSQIPLLGWGNFIFTLTYGVVQNVLLPILVVIFSVYMLITYPLKFVIALTLLLFIVYLGLVSERKSDDLKAIIWLPLYPIYQFLMRLITAFSMVNEVVRRSHEESSMAPWWVLKRGKKF